MSKSKYYIRNEDLIIEIIKFKEEGVASEKLGKMLLDIATKFSTTGRFSGYTWRQDMISEAVLTCIKYLKNFNLEKSNNPFSYITQICYHSFIAYIKSQKTHSTIKDVCYRGYNTLVDEQTGGDRAIDYRSIIDLKEK